MGTSLSTQEFDATSVMTKASMTAINPKYVSQYSRQLSLKANTFSTSESYVVRDLDTGELCFRVEQKFFSGQKRLFDNNEECVAVMKTALLKTYQRIYSNDRELFQFDVVNWVELGCQIRDPITGITYSIASKGVSTARRAIIRSNEGVIAKIRTKVRFGGCIHHLEIASGVDVAFVVLMCIAMEQHECSRRRSMSSG